MKIEESDSALQQGRTLNASSAVQRRYLVQIFNSIHQSLGVRYAVFSTHILLVFSVCYCELRARARVRSGGAVSIRTTSSGPAAERHSPRPGGSNLAKNRAH